MEPSRRLSRAIMSPRRAAHLARYTDKRKPNSLSEARAVRNVSVWLEASGFFERPGVVTAGPGFEQFDSRRGNERRAVPLAAVAARVVWACRRLLHAAWPSREVGVHRARWISRARVGMVFYSTDGITSGCT